MATDMKTLVTGATGFIGGNLVRELLRDGVDVRALARASSDTATLSVLGVEVVVGDLLDESSLERAMEGCDHLYHVAALYRLWTPDPRAFEQVNLQGTRNVLEAALKVGVGRVVYTSTASVFGHWKGGPIPDEGAIVDVSDIVDGYHRSKFLAEAEALAYCSRGLPLVIVNPTAPVGPWDVKPTPTGKLVLDFLKGRIPAYIDTGLNLVHVRDVARGHILAMERGRVGECYILGNRNVTLKEAFRLLSRIAHRRAPLLRIPYWVALGTAYMDRWLSGSLLRREPMVPLAGVPIARDPMFYDSSKAVRELGLPQTPIEEALEEAAAWFREHFKVGIAA
ncbi:MAG: hopanoid-associated sugar epimerase [Dehalococcoidia bacterium]